jgi:hypothetical protein
MSKPDSDVELSWYEPESIAQSIRNGLDRNLKPDKVAEYLAEHGFEEIPEARLQRVIDAMPPETKANKKNDCELSQPKQTEVTPRAQHHRELMAGDFEYFSPREAARVIGLILELFDGNTIRPRATTTVETDLVWHRQHETVALRIVPLADGSLEANHIQALVEGTVVPPETRSPSRLAVVTNRGFTDDATEAAAEHDILWFNGGQLEELVRRARIPMDAVGTVLEDGEAHDGPMTDLVEVVPIPEPRNTENPLHLRPAFDVSSLEATEEQSNTKTSATPEHSGQNVSHGQTARHDDPLTDSPSDPGETGTLYADPTEDGDYDAFDNYLEGL